jgi:hypothetical protein
LVGARFGWEGGERWGAGGVVMLTFRACSLQEKMDDSQSRVKEVGPQELDLKVSRERKAKLEIDGLLIFSSRKGKKRKQRTEERDTVKIENDRYERKEQRLQTF